MATKTSKKTDSIPATSTPLVRAGNDAASLLGALSGKAGGPKKAAKPQRPEMDLSKHAEELFGEFAPAKELADIFTERAEALKGELNEEIFDGWVSKMWESKHQPTNPALKARKDGKVDCEGMFVVQERIKVQIPDPNNASESVISLLSKTGVSEPAARKLIENEIDFRPSVGLRPFTELVDGHYEERNFVSATDEEKEVAKKILEFVTNNLTDEEKAIVLRSDAKTTVKNGFLERVVTYVGSEAELKSVFKVLVPVVQNKGAKFAVGDTPVGKTQRLISKAAEVLGTSQD